MEPYVSAIYLPKAIIAINISIMLFSFCPNNCSDVTVLKNTSVSVIIDNVKKVIFSQFVEIDLLSKYSIINNIKNINTQNTKKEFILKPQTEIISLVKK